MPKLSLSLNYLLNAVIKNSTILTRGVQLKNMKSQQNSVLIFKREVPGICPVCPMFIPALYKSYWLLKRAA